VKHGEHRGEDDLVHVGGALMVRRTVLLLCSSVDPDTGAQDGPVVHVGGEEYTLYEAEALIDALTQLVDRATQGTGLDGERPAQGCTNGE
jgi:hypothetical protein